MSDATLIADLIAAGTPPMLVQRVAMEVMRAQLEREALQRRKDQDRDRQSRRRRLSSRDVTGNHEQNVTPRDITVPPAAPLDVPPLPPAPPSPPLNPPTSPGSEAIASAPAAAGPKAAPVELTVSDRIWVEFPAVLADMGKRSEGSVRKWLGKLLAKYPAEDVHSALSATVAAGTGDPFGYAMRILNPIRPRSWPPPGERRQKPRTAQDFYTDLANGKFPGASDEPPTDPRRDQLLLIAGGRQ